MTIKVTYQNVTLDSIRNSYNVRATRRMPTLKASYSINSCFKNNYPFFGPNFLFVLPFKLNNLMRSGSTFYKGV